MDGDIPATPQNALMTSTRRMANVPRSSTFRSLVNFVASPFHRSEKKAEPKREREASGSVSGSEDNWQGSPPADPFTLARAQETNSPDPRHEMDEDEEVHVHFNQPTMSARTMLTRFLEAKAGAPMSADDMRSFELLTERVAAEDGAAASRMVPPSPVPFVFGTRGERAESTAFSFSHTNLMPSKPLSRSQTTSNIFASTSAKPSARRPTYLGPGMSSRRKPVASSSRLFATPVLPGDKRKADDSSEVAEKKRRIESEEASVAEQRLSSSKSMPDFAHLRALGQPKETEQKSQLSRLRESVVATPSPPATPHSETEVESLSTSVKASPAPTSASASAKKRTADIMLDIIDASKTPVPEPPKKEIVNPYQSGLGASTSALHRSTLLRSTRRPATPKRKAASSASTNGATPLGKTPTPLERIESASRVENQPSPSKKIRSLAREHATPSKASTPARTPSPEPSKEPAAPAKPKQSEPPLQSKPVPTPSIPEPSVHSTPTFNAFASSSAKPIEAFQSLSKAQPITKPTFVPPTHTRELSPSPEPVAAPPAVRAPSKPTPKQTSRDIALATPKMALPFFTFTVGFAGPSSSPAREKALEVPQSELPSFSWSLDTKGKGKAIASTWTCSLCSCTSPDDAEKCTVCEEPRPQAKAKASASQAFNWGAAGLAPKVSTDEWSCPTCMLQNPADADKCTVCEEPKPGKKAVAGPPAAFNWGAAGLAPQVAASEKWKCPTCMLENPKDASKCTICEEPKPGQKAAAQPPAAFNWGAAGLAPKKAASNKWNCPTCMLENPVDAPKCTVCEEPKPGGVQASASSTPATAAPAPQAFNWGAAGLKQSSAGWECSVCMVKNATDATQCVACESPK